MTRAPADLTSPQRRLLKCCRRHAACSRRSSATVALAQSAPDYKALVCIFLQGGNDGENTLIRHDTAGYQTYAAIRTTGVGHQHSAGAAAADPAGARRTRRTDSIRRARLCRHSSTRRSWRSSRTSACSSQPSTKPGLETAGRAAAGESVLAHRSGARAAERGRHGLRAHWAGAGASRTGSTPRIPERCFRRWSPRTGCARSSPGRTSVPLTVPRIPGLHAVQQRRRTSSSTTRCATPRCARCCAQAAATSTTSWRSSTPRKGWRRRRSCAPILAEHGTRW